MKFCFLTHTQAFLGTYRIWFRALPRALSQEGHNVETNPTELSSDVDCFVVTPEQNIEKLRRDMPNALIGTLKPQYFFKKEYSQKIQYLDFLVAGTRFESDQLLPLGLPIVILRHADEIWEDLPELANHELSDADPKKPIMIGYHGNRQHLEQLGGYIGQALEELSQETPIRLNAIYNISAFGRWQIGRPSIPISDIQWDQQTYLKKLKESDIGIVPNNSPSTRQKRFNRIMNMPLFSGHWLGSHENDVFLRLKRTSNAGRGFIFAQLGLPIVSCPIPEILETLVPADAAIPATNKESWKAALRLLIENPQLRKDMGKRGYDWTKKNLSMNDEAVKFIHFLIALSKKDRDLSV